MRSVPLKPHAQQLRQHLLEPLLPGPPQDYPGYHWPEPATIPSCIFMQSTGLKASSHTSAQS